MPAIIVDLMTWLGIGTVANTAAGAIGGVKNVTTMSPVVKYGLIGLGAILLIKILK